jgi:hypothetical protein
MNTEQFEQQQKAAVAIEQGVHDIARIEVLINRGLDLAAGAATDVLGLKFAEETGHVMGDATAQKIAAEMRAELTPAIAAIVKKVGAETLARSPDAAFTSLGQSLGENHMKAWGHKLVDLGRRTREKQAAAEFASRVPEPLPASFSNPVAMANNPFPQPLATASEALKRVEEAEARARQYPSKKASKR